MGLLGLDANSSSSSLTQAQVSSQYGTAIGANTGKGAASSNAGGSTVITGGVKIGKGGSVVINSSNADLNNSILSGLDNITSLLQNEPTSTLSPVTNAGNAGASGAGSDSGISALTSSVNDLLGELQNNQAQNTQASTALLDQLNAGGSSDISNISHPPLGGLVFAPSSGSNETSQGNSSVKGLVIGIVVAVVTAVAVGFAVKKLKLN